MLAALGLCCFGGLSLGVASGDCSLVLVLRLLIVMAFLLWMEHRLQSLRASVVWTRGFRGPSACDPTSAPCIAMRILIRWTTREALRIIETFQVLGQSWAGPSKQAATLSLACE